MNTANATGNPRLTLCGQVSCGPLSFYATDIYYYYYFSKSNGYRESGTDCTRLVNSAHSAHGYLREGTFSTYDRSDLRALASAVRAWPGLPHLSKSSTRKSRSNLCCKECALEPSQRTGLRRACIARVAATPAVLSRMLDLKECFVARDQEAGLVYT